jgi:glutathione peroxidase-family protein
VRTGFTLLVLTLFAGFGVSSCNSTDDSARKTGPVVSVQPGKPYPAVPTTLGRLTLPPNVLGAELKAVSGAPIRLSDYSGKVLLVNLWATWCGPCRVETPELVRLHKEYQAKGVEVIGLSTENPDASAEEVKDFVRQYNVDYRIGWSTREVSLTLIQGNTAIPQSFIVSRDGHVVKRFVGFNPVATPPQLKQAIEDALKG